MVTTDCHLCPDPLPHSDEGNAEDGRLCLMGYKGVGGGVMGVVEGGTHGGGKKRKEEESRGEKGHGVRCVDITM